VLSSLLVDIGLGLVGRVSNWSAARKGGGVRAYLVGVLVELVADGITSSLGSGSEICIGVLGDLYLQVVSYSCGRGGRGEVQSIPLLVSLEACETPPWMVSET
jgi:hypothetical protein